MKHLKVTFKLFIFGQILAFWLNIGLVFISLLSCEPLPLKAYLIMPISVFLMVGMTGIILNLLPASKGKK